MQLGRIAKSTPHALILIKSILHTTDYGHPSCRASCRSRRSRNICQSETKRWAWRLSQKETEQLYIQGGGTSLMKFHTRLPVGAVCWPVLHFFCPALRKGVRHDGRGDQPPGWTAFGQQPLCGPLGGRATRTHKKCPVFCTTCSRGLTTFFVDTFFPFAVRVCTQQ